MQAGEVGNLRCETTGVVDGTWGHIFWPQDAVGNGDTMIVLTEGGCLVDDTSTVFSSYVGIVQDAERAVLVL